MPSLVQPELFLCVDGGGTSVKVVVVSISGAVLGRGASGPCNVKSVGPEQAIAAILRATYAALAGVDSVRWPNALAASLLARPPSLDHQPFAKVWLGLAGISGPSDVAAFLPYAREALHVSADAADSLRLTNDGHLLASRCAVMPHVDSTVVLVAGTGTVGHAFRKRQTELELVGVSGGWGYLLGDEGSAYSIGRLAIRYILDNDDARQTQVLCGSSVVLKPANPLITALLAYFDVPDAAALVDKTYSDHSTPTNSSFSATETNRKVWIAEATRVVFAFAFGADRPALDPSRLAALSIVAAGVQPLVQLALRLVGDRSVVAPARALLSLGGGLWKVPGYVELLLLGLGEAGVVFADVVVVADAPEEGARALAAQARARRTDS
ncbi:hypothetical protein JCM21900_006643 [Sporobolomyces salmonicolor]